MACGCHIPVPTFIKCTAPGVPDIYQGTELWDNNLVDPDNRRPVDFDRRFRMLAETRGLSAAEILKRHAEGLPKLFYFSGCCRLAGGIPSLRTEREVPSTGCR